MATPPGTLHQLGQSHAAEGSVVRSSAHLGQGKFSAVAQFFGLWHEVRAEREDRLRKGRNVLRDGRMGETVDDSRISVSSKGKYVGGRPPIPEQT